MASPSSQPKPNGQTVAAIPQETESEAVKKKLRAGTMLIIARKSWGGPPCARCWTQPMVTCSSSHPWSPARLLSSPAVDNCPAPGPSWRRSSPVGVVWRPSPTDGSCWCL